MGAGCGPTIKRSLIFEKELSLNTGRFVGPIEVKVPRREEGSFHDYQYELILESGCGPLLRISFPDGEVGSVGDQNDVWQSLLARRAASPEATLPPQIDQVATKQEPSVTPQVPENYVPPPAQGHWQQTQLESWQGQLEFMAKLPTRCAVQKTYSKRHTTAFDESGLLKIWAEVPQELTNAKVTLRVFALIDEEAAAARVRSAKRALERERRALARAEVEVGVERVRERPDRPAPKREKPKAAKAAGAIWVSGTWLWNEGKGKWAWDKGYWGSPKTRPALKAEGQGTGPIVGCRWQPGNWSWQTSDGSWTWTAGYWLAPPPKVEVPGTPPVPESSWIPGRWISTKVSFRWVSGRFGKPSPRVEVIPASPYSGARWRAGAWLKLKGKWIWSPGFYEKSTSAPPPRKTENPGAPPVAGAIWLSGYWRWAVASSSYNWNPGHWEYPPGEGYVWIPAPPDPGTGYSIGGKWILQIDVRGTVR